MIRGHIINHRAFTIVELLIVIVVIAILATVALVGYNGVQNRAREGAVKTNLLNMTKKLEIYKTKNNGAYPANLTSAEVITPNEGTYSYTANGGVYCLSGVLGAAQYRITSLTSTLVGGTCATDNPAAAAQWSPRKQYQTGDYVLVNGNLYVATTAHAPHGPRVVQVGAHSWNGTYGATMTQPWPDQSQVGDLMMIAVWQGSSATGTHSLTLTANGTTYAPIDEFVKTTASSYRGAIYLVPRISGTQVQFATSTYVSAVIIALRDTTAGNITTLRKTTANSLVLGEWDPAARSLTYNGMIMTVGRPRNYDQQWTWTVDNGRVSADSFITGWADYTNANTQLVITTAISTNAAAVWTFGVSQPAFDTTGWQAVPL